MATPTMHGGAEAVVTLGGGALLEPAPWVEPVPLPDPDAAEAAGWVLGGLPQDRIAPGKALTQTLPTQDSTEGVGRQIASALMLQPDRPIELTLSPEELGRVRLTLTSIDGGISVAIIAERAETLDLMRRNIDMLARDFREMGYGSVAFSFGNQPRQGQGDPSPDPTHEEPTPAAVANWTVAIAGPIRLTVTGSGGLDLRY